MSNGMCQQVLDILCTVQAMALLLALGVTLSGVRRAAQAEERALADQGFHLNSRLQLKAELDRERGNLLFTLYRFSMVEDVGGVPRAAAAFPNSSWCASVSAKPVAVDVRLAKAPRGAGAARGPQWAVAVLCDDGVLVSSLASIGSDVNRTDVSILFQDRLSTCAFFKEDVALLDATMLAEVRISRNRPATVLVTLPTRVAAVELEQMVVRPLATPELLFHVFGITPLERRCAFEEVVMLGSTVVPQGSVDVVVVVLASMCATRVIYAAAYDGRPLFFTEIPENVTASAFDAFTPIGGRFVVCEKNDSGRPDAELWCVEG